MKYVGLLLAGCCAQAACGADYRLEEFVFRRYGDAQGVREETLALAYGRDGQYTETHTETMPARRVKSVTEYAGDVPVSVKNYHQAAQGGWQLDDEIVNRYDADGNLLGWERRDYGAAQAGREAGRKSVTEREEGRETTTVSALRDGAWVAEEQSVQELDAQGLLTALEIAVWDAARQAFVPRMRDEHLRMADGAEETHGFVWRDGAWQAAYKIRRERGGDGLMHEYRRERHWSGAGGGLREESLTYTHRLRVGGLLLEWDENRIDEGGVPLHKTFSVQPWPRHDDPHDIWVYEYDPETRQWDLLESERVARDAAGRVREVWQADRATRLHRRYLYDAQGLLQSTETTVHLANGKQRVTRSDYTFDKTIARAALRGDSRRDYLPAGVRADYALAHIRTYRLEGGGYVPDEEMAWRYGQIP